MIEQRSDIQESILTELAAIRKLLVFQLLQSGASQRQVADALGVNQSQISHMFPRSSSSKGK